jgi:hypothetical protein
MPSYHLFRPFFGMKPFDQVQCHVDPGRNPRGGDDPAGVDEAVVRSNLDPDS